MMNLYTKRLCFLLLVLMTSCMFTSAQITTDVINGVSNGNASIIKRYLNNDVELVIKNRDNIYSKEQANSIIVTFFKQNPPTKCTKVHEGERDKSQFVICNLETKNGVFRIYFLIKDNLIYQLRIENPND